MVLVGLFDDGSECSGACLRFIVTGPITADPVWPSAHGPVATIMRDSYEQQNTHVIALSRNKEGSVQIVSQDVRHLERQRIRPALPD